MNLPNRITLSRFGLGLLLFAYLVWTDTCSGPEWWSPALAGSVFILVVITDALDGYYARKLGQQSDFGRIADPVVDKILVCGAFIFLASSAWGRQTVPVWMAVLFAGREFMVSGLRGFIEARGVAFPARWDGKLKMVLQCIAVPAVFLDHTFDLVTAGAVWDVPWWLAGTAEGIMYGSVWLAFAVTLGSGARYVSSAARLLRESAQPAP